MGWVADGLAIILPARLQSTRLPRKLLIEVAGRTILEWTWRRACATGAPVWVATDSAEIASAAQSFGARVLQTGAQPNGTQRVAAAAELLDPLPRWVVNLQGDEPLIDPLVVARVAERTQAEQGAIVTAAAPMACLEDWLDPGVVKVVCAGERALYFSRAPIPSSTAASARETFARARETALQHVGIYGFSLETLRRYARLPASPLADIESLEQLRALEAGIPISVVRVSHASPAVDTPADLARIEPLLAAAAGAAKVDPTRGGMRR
ncbi:MAG: 3-deoxy-manno-octulosonate cytidylyltransferase [Candidatus Eisenbacteria bacterium]|nr:3-deoxy-manno-octulosonate cytidylyltransferase [Candidatus Eisenbacteria bacterium]